MQGKVIILAGARGEGKSTIVKNLLSSIPMPSRMVYDVQAEYSPEYIPPTDELPPFDEFIEMAGKVKQKLIVFEEATAFLSGRIGFKMRDVIVSARHRKNTIVLVFHSVAMVPKDVIYLGNYLVLLRTADNPEDSLKRLNNQKIYQALLESKKLRKYEHITVEYL